MDKRTLSPHLQGKYELLFVQPGEVKIDGISYDFRTITLAQADKLYNRPGGCRYLKKIEPPKKQVKSGD